MNLISLKWNFHISLVDSSYNIPSISECLWPVPPIIINISRLMTGLASWSLAATNCSRNPSMHSIYNYCQRQSVSHPRAVKPEYCESNKLYDFTGSNPPDSQRTHTYPYMIKIGFYVIQFSEKRCNRENAKKCKFMKNLQFFTFLRKKREIYFLISFLVILEANDLESVFSDAEFDPVVFALAVKIDSPEKTSANSTENEAVRY